MKLAIILFVLVTAIGIAMAAYSFTRSGGQVALTTPTPIPTATDLPLETPSTAPVVVYESEANIPADDKKQLEERVVNPYIDFYAESGPQIVSLTLNFNTQPSKTTYPYAGKAIFQSGAYNDFLIQKTNGEISWWVPECLNGCQFSDSFKEKYPDIVEISQ